jgi:hypothetical protein
MSEINEQPERALLFKIADASGKSVLVSKSFRTRATNENLEKHLDSEVKRINEIFDKLPSITSTFSKKTKLFSLIFTDLETGESARPIFMIGDETDTSHGMRNGIFKEFDVLMQKNIHLIYENLLHYLELKEWDFYTCSDAQWREACAACHPFFLTPDWTEEKREKFGRLSWNSLKVGLQRGTYKINFTKNKTKAVLSAHSKDKTPLVQKRTQKPKSKRLTSSKRVASNGMQRKAEHPRGQAKGSKTARRNPR